MSAADGITRRIAPTQALSVEGEFHAFVHHDYRTPHDLPAGACRACGSAPESWCPDCAACKDGCYGGHDDNPCDHRNASWGQR